MKILIHALGANMGGAIRHLYNFIPAIMQYDKSNQYVLILRDDIEFSFKCESLQTVRISKTIGANFLLRTIFDIIYLPVLAIKLKADIVISLLNFGPIFCSKPHINFQRNSLYFCNYYLDNIKGTQKFITWLRSVLIYFTMKYAAMIVTPSNSMAEQIKLKYPSLKAKAYSTLYHGFELETNENTTNDWIPILKNDKRIRILYPTHPSPHKGFEILFTALAKLKIENRNNNFVLYTTIGKTDWPSGIKKYTQQIKELDIVENVVFTGRIPQDQIYQLYKNCDLMIYPSLCESFGFSLIEAMAYKLPILAAATDTNKEICGQGAFYYSPFDPQDAFKKLELFLNDEFRNNFRMAGEIRFKSFDWSWKHYAIEFLQIVKNI